MKDPATKFDIWTVILKVVSDWMLVLPYSGKVIMEETMFVLAGMSPMATQVSSTPDAMVEELTNAIARTPHNLEPIGKRLPCTVVDEVVGRGF